VQLAAREGYVSVEHTKRYTTLGMATDQGKLSNINGLAILAGALDAEIPAVGHHHLPPAVVAGDAWARWRARPGARSSSRCGKHADARLAPRPRSAYLEPVGLWQRPFAYPRVGRDP
jgi:sarcosine oxidase subunit alpha